MAMFEPGQQDYITKLNYLAGLVDLAQGDKGWSPQIVTVIDGARVVLQIADWIGGSGTKPAAGQYLGNGVLVTNIANAIDVRGSTGPKGDTGNTGAVGPSNVLTIGTVTEGSASATITGTSPSQVLNLIIPKGNKGDTGAVGPSNVLTIGTVTEGTAGATITGTTPSQVLNLAIPKGNTGAAATVAIGTVTTGAAGSNAAVSNSGTSGAAVFNFTIPRGDTGSIDAAPNLPAIWPTLLLDFANSLYVDPRITFTRASSATYFDWFGVLRTATSGVPRIDFDPVTGARKGLLIEEARTNLLKYSEQFDNAGWAKTRSTVVANATIAPDGTLTADKLVEDTTASNSHYVYQGTPVTSGTAYTLSAYVKAAERTNVALMFFNDNGAFALSHVYFNLSTGVVTDSSEVTSASITNVGNGWYRVAATQTAIATGTGNIGLLLMSSGVTYTGDGTSGIYIWGAQLEAGAFPTSYIPSSVTFTGRASTATYFGSDGLLKTAASGEARYNYNPSNLTIAGKLLIEEARTNLLTYSEQFDNAAWSKTGATVTANAATAPDGAVTMDLLKEDTATGTHSATETITIVAGSTVSSTIFVKQAPGATRYLRVQVASDAGANGFRAYFDMTTGTVALSAQGFGTGTAVTGSASVTALPGGVFRVSVSGTVAPGATSAGMTNFLQSTPTGSASYTGDGTSGLYIWGAQLEAGSSPTSYIPTTSAAATRAADTSTSAASTRAADLAVMTGTNFSKWYRHGEGTFVVSFSRALAAPSTRAPCVLSVVNGTDPTNSMSISGGYAVPTQQRFDVQAAGVTTAQIVLTTGITNGQVYAAAAAYKADDMAGCFGGGVPVTDTSSAVPTVDNLVIGGLTGAVNYLNGHIKRIAYYNRRLSNSELQALTA